MRTIEELLDERGLDDTLSVTIDHMNAVPASYVLEKLGIEVGE